SFRSHVLPSLPGLKSNLLMLYRPDSRGAKTKRRGTRSLVSPLELGLAREDAAWLRPFVAGDDPPALEHVDQSARPRVADAQPPLEQRDRRGLRLDDDIDGLIEQGILVGIELAVVAGGL